ncbi:hypothetical protein B0H17DRAFT_1328325 [Mycena rosella]|uniref:Novel STAND NTPase 1 domain-containing protein n=1 Tax=Mycena rosella TaxID=1033263 RepID=A0AAD7GNJ4_MYCRO|nr:hypothetical protein B0H17DRAFT_1328325 [Mycena rosella]
MTESSKGVLAPSIQRTTVAAATLKQLSEINSTPYIKVVAGVSLLILETVQSVKTNKEECAAFIEQIDQLLCIIIDLCSEPSAALPLALLDAIGKFAQTLQKIEVFMRMQQGMGRFKRFWRQQENIAQLKDCKKGLNQVFDAFSIKTSLAVAEGLADMRLATEKRHQDLLKLISDTYSFNQTSSTSSGTPSSSGSLALMLPSAPQIFHGRESELAAVVGLLLKDAPRVAILGAGGIGKTSLAKSALHHPDIMAKYPDRYFVSCDSSGTVEDLAFSIATTLGLELTGKISKAVVKHLSARFSCLLVLDNFETPWEASASRPKVDEFLSLLADFEHVALVVTMRGQERPLKIRWTRPFIPPLKPLSSDAARKTFLDISDADGDEDAPHVAELLALTENLPLAVTLMATVASFDGCEPVLARWKTENISLLSDGFNKETNLETSVRISLSSPRMTSSPAALQLLSVLSLLPDGILDVDLVECPIPDLPRSKTTLLRTALAYEDAERLKVLAPVRELIRKIHPPSYPLIQSLHLHWGDLLKLWRTYEMPSGNLAQRLMGNSGNITSILKYGLDVGAPDLKEILYDIFHLDGFSSSSYGNPSPLVDHLAENIERMDDNQLRGHYIWHLFNENNMVSSAEAQQLIAQGCRFYQLAGDLVGEARFHHVVSKYYICKADINKASVYADISLSLADQADHKVRQFQALCGVGECKQMGGKFREALEFAQRAQRLAGRMGNFQRETQALEQEAFAWIGLGNFPRAAAICSYLQELVIAGGLEGSNTEMVALDLEGDINLYQTAYPESRRSHEHILHNSSPEKFSLFHGNSLTAIASIDVILHVFESEAEVVAALRIPRQIFTAREATQLYENCVRSFRGEDADFFFTSMMKLADITLRHDVRSTTHWATTSLAFGKTTLNPSAISWAFRLLGDIFRTDGDDETSCVLFQVALEEFNRMGEFAEKRGEHIVATQHFCEARCMFLKSGMTTEAEQVPVRYNYTEKRGEDTLVGDRFPEVPRKAPMSEMVTEVERVPMPM